MARRIEVEVGKDGRLKVEFSGFSGDTCYDEAEALAKALKELGLWAIPVSLAPKSPTQIEREVGTPEAPAKRVPLS